MKALVAGWFSFPEMGATAGDVLVRDVVCGWLDEAGCPYDVAVADPFTNGVDWQTVAQPLLRRRVCLRAVWQRMAHRNSSRPSPDAD